MPTHEILKDLFFIERGYLNANHFVYRSEAPILIDSGYASGFDETERLISATGAEISRVSLIINTHTHCDHIGGNHRIQQRSGCEIALHRIGMHFIDTRDDWSTWWRYYRQEAQFFDCTRGLEDGDVIAVGPHEFDVIYTPGHASDGIVLYNRRHKVLISSDTLWERDMAVMTLRIEGSTALFRTKASLRKIESLDVRRVYPGHGKPFTDFHGALQRAHARIGAFIRDRTRVGNDLIKKIIVYTLMMRGQMDENEMYPYLMDTRWFRETVDLYFNGAYEERYADTIHKLIRRGIVEQKNGRLSTTVKP